MKRSALTPRQIESMRAVSGGADVLDYGIAMDLRAVQRAHPKLIVITKRMHRYKGHERLPYFGAILTAAGRAVVAKRIGGAS